MYKMAATNRSRAVDYNKNTDNHRKFTSVECKHCVNLKPTHGETENGRLKKFGYVLNVL
ncbi:MAG: hypothetical protein FWG64_11850 [Firmicutes bacterium]|nr:hypothetical protein [Bacillota bacterium]